MKTFALDSFCVNCRSSQSLEPRWVGIGTNPIVGAPAMEFWSVALCASCRRNRILSVFQEKVKPLYGALGICGGGLLICWLGWGMQPQQPSPGYRWTAPAQLFHGLIPVMPYVFGLAAVLLAPVFLWRLMKTLRARTVFGQTAHPPADLSDDIYAASARERLRAACSETDTPPPGAAHGARDFEVVGAGSTPESTLNLAWANVFLRQHPERKAQAAEACDRKLRTIPLYFVYGLGLSAVLMGLGGLLDSENQRGWTGFLHVPGIILFFPGVVLTVKPWLEDGLNEYRKIFEKGLFSSRALRRYWGGIALSILMLAAVVPAYRHGVRKNPFLSYTQKNEEMGGWTVRLEYPRHWRRGPSELIMKPQPQVWINVYSQTTLPNDPQAAQAEIKSIHGLFSPAESWRMEPLAWSGRTGWWIDQPISDGRMLTAYLPAPKGYFVLRMSDPESSPVHEEAFRRLIASVRITTP